MQTVRILADAPNGVVVQCEGRRFPGLVVQGDRLTSWLQCAKTGTDDSIAMLVDLLEDSARYLQEVTDRHL